jgi:hypothetical protein
VKIEFKKVIEIPGESFSDMYTKTPFTIIMNKPSVSKIAGSDKMTMIGFRTVLTSENTKPANKMPVTVILGWMFS